MFIIVWVIKLFGGYSKAEYVYLEAKYQGVFLELKKLKKLYRVSDVEVKRVDKIASSSLSGK